MVIQHEESAINTGHVLYGVPPSRSRIIIIVTIIAIGTTTMRTTIIGTTIPTR